MLTEDYIRKVERLNEQVADTTVRPRAARDLGVMAVGGPELVEPVKVSFHFEEDQEGNLNLIHD